MPQYGGKDIKEMTDEELVAASFALEQTLGVALKKREHPKFKEKMKNQVQTINPAFSELRNEIKAELDKRNNNNANQ